MGLRGTFHWCQRTGNMKLEFLSKKAGKPQRFPEEKENMAHKIEENEDQFAFLTNDSDINEVDQKVDEP